MTPSPQDILAILRALQMPEGIRDVSDLLIKNEADGAHVAFALEIDPAQAKAMEPIRLAAEKAVRAMSGVTSVSAVLTAHKAAPTLQSASRPLPAKQVDLKNIKHIIAVASGKGGVGKSTTAVNLAVALAMNGHKTGLLDADVYGPSIPRLLGLKGQPEIDANKKMVPFRHLGLEIMSMGFLVAEETPMVWRGPMVHSAIVQMMRDVAWGDLDILVIDMPPGTGDIHLTVIQQVPLAGAIIVSTPQDIALIDARKGLAMFQKMKVPVLGFIENMSYFSCPHCGERTDIFSHGGAEAEAQKLGVPFLGAIPLDAILRETSDAGTPITAAMPDSVQAKIYREMAERVWEEVSS